MIYSVNILIVGWIMMRHCDCRCQNQLQDRMLCVLLVTAFLSPGAGGVQEAGVSQSGESDSILPQLLFEY